MISSFQLQNKKKLRYKLTQCQVIAFQAVSIDLLSFKLEDINFKTTFFHQFRSAQKTPIN